MTVTILDGGMGRELLRIGAPFRQPEWSALALMDGPQWVVRAHQNFIEAGATVITTNSYACVPFHIGAELFAARGAELVSLSGQLARQATQNHPGVRVAGSLPPVFGSYRPDLFDAANVGSILDVLVNALDQYVDIWLIETTGSIAEATAALTAIAPTRTRPIWVSFTLLDALDHSGHARLRSGESLAQAVAAIGPLQGLLFNCSQPEVMEAAVREAASLVTATTEIGVYANAFPVMEEDREANDGLSAIRDDLTPKNYAAFATQWRDCGATIIGGCCGIAPDHIVEISRTLT